MSDDRSVTLLSKRDKDSSRYTGAWVSDGILHIEGQDLGRPVERAFGFYEYEWAYRIGPPEIEKLVAALGCGDDVLDALAARFSGENEWRLPRFLREHDVQYRFWSRIGD